MATADQVAIFERGGMARVDLTIVYVGSIQAVQIIDQPAVALSDQAGVVARNANICRAVRAEGNISNGITMGPAKSETLFIRHLDGHFLIDQKDSGLPFRGRLRGRGLFSLISQLDRFQGV